MQRRGRRKEQFVNTLKMASGCCGCGFQPQSEAECRLLDLNHYGGGRVGAWAEKSVGYKMRLIIILYLFVMRYPILKKPLPVK